MPIDVELLALSFDKPVDFVKRCLKFHGISELPRFRTADDGLAQFYSDMTSLYFDPNLEGPLDDKGKPTYPQRSLTKQEFAAECDINNIMARFTASGFDPSVLPLTSRQPRYGDFSNMPESYHEALNYVKATEQAFLMLPAEFRAKLKNDPQLFLDYIKDPANYDELVDLGVLLQEPAVDVPTSKAKAGSSDPVGAKDPLKPSKGAKNDRMDHSGEGGTGD